MGEKKYRTYREFWPFYLREHSLVMNRAVHYTGTMLTLVVLVTSCLMKEWSLLLFMPVAGYSFAWAGHLFIQKNHPATFIHPWWSLISDYRMFFLFILGRLKPHLKGAGII